MLRPICKIAITQVSNKDYPDRNSTFTFDFVNSIEIHRSWANLSDTAKLIFPMNIYFVDQTGKKVSWVNKNIVSGNTSPILLRGDKIEISLGYKFYDSNNNEQTQINVEFDGYISKITNRIPIEIECTDQMYALQQISTPNKVYKGSQYNVQSMLGEMLQGSNTDIGVVADSKTNIGDFRTNNETVAQVLKRLQNDYRLESYFKGGNLYCSGLVYLPEFAKEVEFSFQNNIIEDDLEYTRQDDLNIGIKAYSCNEVVLNTTTPSGKPRKKRTRLSVFVTKDGIVNESGFEGEKRTLYLWNIKDVNDLATKARDRMNRFYYEGFQGSFLTFGLPYVDWGYDVKILDSVLPERNGVYKVKSVNVTYGMGGFRRSIELDMRIDQMSEQQIAQGL